VVDSLTAIAAVKQAGEAHVLRVSGQQTIIVAATVRFVGRVSSRPRRPSAARIARVAQQTQTRGSRIKSGELRSGSRLPPERELAQDCGVAYDTIRRAAVLLRERGLIITVHGRGTYVA
jgi:hypothetical protein